MSDTKQYSRGHLLGILATIFCVLMALLLLVNRQYVVDQLSVWQYKPSGDVAALVNRIGLSDTGKFLLYAGQPAIENAQEFNKECDRKENSTAILGCYNGRNIFIYNVTDSRLSGIKEVTAAHEMLHAAYMRMGEDERKAVDSLLEAEYNKLKNNAEFEERMAFYARTEPGERDNELHSVIGTEVANISPTLEDHYKNYFSDRGIVVAHHTQYAAVFASLQSKADTLTKRLTDLGNTIDRERTQYNTEVTQFNVDMDDFNRRARGDGFSSEGSYKSELATLTNRADELNQFRTSIEEDIKTYQSLQQELAGVASQSQDLTKSIDSSLAPAPSL